MKSLLSLAVVNSSEVVLVPRKVSAHNTWIVYDSLSTWLFVVPIIKHRMIQNANLCREESAVPFFAIKRATGAPGSLLEHLHRVDPLCNKQDGLIRLHFTSVQLDPTRNLWRQRRTKCACSRTKNFASWTQRGGNVHEATRVLVEARSCNG